MTLIRRPLFIWEMTEHMIMPPPGESGSSRRQFCGLMTAAAAAALLPKAARGAESTVGTSADHQEVAIDPDQALKRLLEGNQRFADGRPRHPHETADWRLSLERGQHPFAVILGCADSRVCPELVFDQGFGDLFVIRVAGNIVDVDVTASIEYAVDHLASKLVVVLGHSNCGAVTATLDHLTDSASEPDEIVSLLYRIEPALAGLPQDLPREELISQAVRKNVQFAVQRLSQVPDLRKNIKRNNLKIVGTVYNMHTGRVELLPS